MAINLAPNCHGWWKMNEDAANGFVEDFSPQGNHGASSQNTEDINVVGKVGGGLFLTKLLNEEIDVGTMGNFGSNMNNVTITMWYKIPSRFTLSPAIVVVNTLDGTALLVHLNADKNNINVRGIITAIMRDSTGNALQFTTNADTGITDQSWHFIVIRFRKSAGTGKIYVDNVEKAVTIDVAGTGINMTNFDISMYLGHNDGGVQWAWGHFDIMGLFNKALSVAEMTFLWSNGNGTESLGTNTEINIGDVWKDVDSFKINIGDVWKDVVEVKQNIGDVWKDVF